MTDFATTIGMVLRQKDGQIAFVRPDASVYQAIEIMADKKVGALLVMEGSVLLGIISERDYARKVILQGRLSKETHVSEIMTSPVITVTRQHSVGECMRIITNNRIRHLPVVENGAVLGVVSIGDLVSMLRDNYPDPWMQQQGSGCPSLQTLSLHALPCTPYCFQVSLTRQPEATREAEWSRRRRILSATGR